MVGACAWLCWASSAMAEAVLGVVAAPAAIKAIPLATASMYLQLDHTLSPPRTAPASSPAPTSSNTGEPVAAPDATPPDPTQFRASGTEARSHVLPSVVVSSPAALDTGAATPSQTIPVPDNNVHQAADIPLSDTSPTTPSDWLPILTGVEETLQEAIRKTLQTNPDVLIDAARRKSTGEAAKNARSGLYPRVDVTMDVAAERLNNSTVISSYGSTITQQRNSGSLTLTQMLFDGLGTQREIERNEARVESAAHKLASTSEQTALRAVENYLEVLRLQEIVQLTEENLAAHQRTYDQIKLRASSGVGRRADQTQIEARVALASASQKAAAANLRVAQINYKLVVGNLPQKLVRPSIPDLALLPPDVEEAIKRSTKNNRVLQSASADVDAAYAQYLAAKAPLLPRVDLEVSATRNNSGNITNATGTNFSNTRDKSESAMVKMRFNLFDGGSTRAAIGESSHLLEEAREVMRRAERQLEQSVRLSWTAYISAKDRLPSLRQHAEASVKTHDAYVKQFTLGQRTLLDLLDTENELFTSSTNYINGQYVELYSRYRVLTDAGLILQALGVPPREEAMLPAP